ncbi:MAG: L-histidine N(alpha)-methyltransferase [Bacteroidales bacterium]|nr:L-histidine N(alpha)-methyltransferase [Bacteroidales bacterium]
MNLIELGAGDGMKTRTIIDALLRNNKDFSYIPVDISREAIDRLK